MRADLGIAVEPEALPLARPYSSRVVTISFQCSLVPLVKRSLPFNECEGEGSAWQKLSEKIGIYSGCDS